MIDHGEIEFNPELHTYRHRPTGQRLTPVSEVIRTVYAKKSWDGVDPGVVDNARLRGVLVDTFMSIFVSTGTVDCSSAPDEVKERVIPACRIFEEQFGGLEATPQAIVYSLEDGVAGTTDFLVDHTTVVDLKCTYAKEKSWVLQMGGYLMYSGYDRAGIIHVSPKVYKEGGRYLDYDALTCLWYWSKAIEWYKETRNL